MSSMNALASYSTAGATLSSVIVISFSQFGAYDRDAMNQSYGSGVVSTDRGPAGRRRGRA